MENPIYLLLFKGKIHEPNEEDVHIRNKGKYIS
jgi:hypothetical protein